MCNRTRFPSLREGFIEDLFSFPVYMLGEFDGRSHVFDLCPRASEYLHRLAKASHYTIDSGEGDGYMLASAGEYGSD